MGAIQLLFAGLVVMHACTFGSQIATLPESPGAKVFIFVFSLLLVLAFVALIQVVFILLSYRPSKNQTILTEHTLRVTDAGLIEETKFNASTFAWPGILKVVQNRRYIFV